MVLNLGSNNISQKTELLVRMNFYHIKFEPQNILSLLNLQDSRKLKSPVDSLVLVKIEDISLLS